VDWQKGSPPLINFYNYCTRCPLQYTMIIYKSARRYTRVLFVRGHLFVCACECSLPPYQLPNHPLYISLSSPLPTRCHLLSSYPAATAVNVYILGQNQFDGTPYKQRDKWKYADRTHHLVLTLLRIGTPHKVIHKKMYTYTD